jgi:hypothetical protein
MYNVHIHDLSSCRKPPAQYVFTSTPGHGQHKSNFTFLTFNDIHLKMYQHYVHTSLGTPLNTATLLTTHFHCTLPPVNADQHTMQRCKVPRLPYSLCCVWQCHMTFQCQTDSCTAWNMSNNAHHDTHFYLVMQCYKKMVWIWTALMHCPALLICHVHGILSPTSLCIPEVSGNTSFWNIVCVLEGGGGTCMHVYVFRRCMSCTVP